MSRRVLHVLISVVVVGLVLSGCSSGPSAKEWASQVCTAITPWRNTITELNQQAAAQMSIATTATQTRANLVTLIGGARDATEQARAAVSTAGVPDVDGGAEMARRFEAALAATRDAYASALRELNGLPVDNEATFYDGVVALLDRLTASFQSTGSQLAGLDSTELRQAFDTVPECR